jgi:hypothetical protein
MPQWARNMPSYLNLSPDQIVRLETLRRQIDVPHEEFFLHIMSHPKMMERSIRHNYNEIKARQPNQSEQRLLSEVLLFYATVRAAAGVTTAGIDFNSGQAEPQAFLIVSSFKSVDDLVAWIVHHEYTVNDPGVVLTVPEYTWAEEEVTKILSERI